MARVLAAGRVVLISLCIRKRHSSFCLSHRSFRARMSFVEFRIPFHSHQ